MLATSKHSSLGGFRALITGISGFVGQHLARLLLDHGVEVHGTVRPGGYTFPLLEPQEITRIVVHVADLADRPALASVVRQVRPAVVYHLAGQAFVPESLRAPIETFETNVVGTVQLFDAILQLGDPLPRVVVAGSAEIFGLVRPEDLPLTERSPFNPVNPYAASKVSQYYAGLAAWRSWRLPVVYAAAFNHIGPGQSDRFVVSSFARQVVEIQLGLRPAVLTVGNLEARRDFTDVRDVVRAYRLLAEHGDPGGSYNVCSGQTWPIATILDQLVGIADVHIEQHVDRDRLRPSDLPVLQGSFAKLRAATGWEPTVSLDQSLRDVLACWRLALSAVPRISAASK